jgi:hypothetical protein
MVLEFVFFGTLFPAFRPFWSGNSNTPDESRNTRFKKVCKTVLPDVSAVTPGHFSYKSV